MPATSRSHPRPFREYGVDAVEQSRRTFEAAARPAGRLQDGIRERAVARGPGHSPPR
ncbi:MULTISPECIES: hypothetical protein [unclassified Streptomyces]|uniref:hypothetical protein n=1 Tax=unclassified Streptomyces TaxID=2593676 RepID=UPI001647DCF5|nr:hypothetical protein [Streptomyces sp. BK340]